MNDSPIAMLEESLEARIETIYRDYIYSNIQDFAAQDGAAAHDNFSEFLLGSLQRIRLDSAARSSLSFMASWNRR